MNTCVNMCACSQEVQNYYHGTTPFFSMWLSCYFAICVYVNGATTNCGDNDEELQSKTRTQFKSQHFWVGCRRLV